MIIINILNEINTIIASAFKTNFILYHGCPSTECYDSIRKHGLIPKINKDTKGKNGKLTPMIDSVYLTKKLSYALIYAFWANMVGSLLTPDEVEKINNGIYSKYGYVFIINSNDISDNVKPDEDTIGELFYHKINNLDYSSETGLSIKHIDIPDFIINIASQYVNKTTYNRAVKYDDYGDLARIGKIIIRYMTVEQKLYLANLVDNISDIGPIIPEHCYRINKFDRYLYKADGSNFFDLAEKLY